MEEGEKVVNTSPSIRLLGIISPLEGLSEELLWSCTIPTAQEASGRGETQSGKRKLSSENQRFQTKRRYHPGNFTKQADGKANTCL